MMIDDNAQILRIYKDYNGLCTATAKEIAEQLQRKTDSVLGLPTGKTPMGVYQELIRMHREEDLDFSKATTFNLDEYLGLSPQHALSYGHFMEVHFFSQVNLQRKNIHLLNGMADNPEVECREFDAAIERAGGIDLMLLGIGRNGHIGFNEPQSSLTLATHVARLDDSTRDLYAGEFGSREKVPEQALAMGVLPIFKSRRILLAANGSAKKKVIGEMLSGKVDTLLPASLLQLHGNLTVLVDAEAAPE